VGTAFSFGAQRFIPAYAPAMFSIKSSSRSMARVTRLTNGPRDPGFALSSDVTLSAGASSIALGNTNAGASSVFTTAARAGFLAGRAIGFLTMLGTRCCYQSIMPDGLKMIGGSPKPITS
jgi:hypothetical protein